MMLLSAVVRSSVLSLLLSVTNNFSTLKVAVHIFTLSSRITDLIRLDLNYQSCYALAYRS